MKQPQNRTRLTAVQKQRVAQFKSALQNVKREAHRQGSTNEQIAASASRYLSRLRGGVDSVVSPQRINHWVTKPAASVAWTAANARVPTLADELAALVLSLLQHRAWGSGSVAAKQALADATEWAAALGLAFDPNVLHLLENSDDPSSDVPSVLDALFHGTAVDARSFLLVLAVTQPSIANDAAALKKLAGFVRNGGTYAIMAPFGPSVEMGGVMAGYVKTTSHYATIRDRSGSAINQLRQYLADDSAALMRTRLITPKFVEASMLGYRILSPIIGVSTRPILFSSYNPRAGSATSKYAVMTTDSRNRSRLEVRVDDSTGGYAEADAVQRELIKEYARDVLQAWARTDYRGLPESLDSAVWEYSDGSST